MRRTSAAHSPCSRERGIVYFERYSVRNRLIYSIEHTFVHFRLRTDFHIHDHSLYRLVVARVQAGQRVGAHAQRRRLHE